MTNLADTEGLWYPVKATDITPKSDTVGIYLNVKDGTGTAWFDDVKLVESRTK